MVNKKEAEIFKAYPWYDKLPSNKIEVEESHLRLFFEMMHERQLIWKRRFLDQKPQPWTENKVFQTSKFTNVYRELDRNSQWLIKNIILDETLDLRNLIWKMMVFRYFNNPATFEFDASKVKAIQLRMNFVDSVDYSDDPVIESLDQLISATKWRNGIPDYEEYDEMEFSRFIAGVRVAGQNPFTTAYLINSMAAKGKSRDYCYTRIVVPALHRSIDQILEIVKTAEAPEDIIKFLMTLPSTAGFIAHEFYQDFTYIPRYTDREFMKFDQNDFTNVGPGAAIGLRLIFPSKYHTNEQKPGIYKLRDMAEEWLTKISQEKGEGFPYLEWDKKERKYYVTDKCNITLHQIEMWLCEFQKYWKMLIGQGKQRSKFVPVTEEIIVK